MQEKEKRWTKWEMNSEKWICVRARTHAHKCVHSFFWFKWQTTCCMIFPEMNEFEPCVFRTRVQQIAHSNLFCIILHNFFFTFRPHTCGARAWVWVWERHVWGNGRMVHGFFYWNSNQLLSAAGVSGVMKHIARVLCIWPLSFSIPATPFHSSSLMEHRFLVCVYAREHYELMIYFLR